MSSREIFRAEALPVLQNRTYETPDDGRNCPVGDVILVQDDKTGLVHNIAFEPKKLEYDAHYQNEQAHSCVFRNHLESVTRIIRRHFSGDKLIEVGCGKAYFLEHLVEHGFDVLGVDPAYEGESERVIRALFQPSLGLRGDAVILRHVLEHIPDPLSFLDAIAQANGGRGKIYIEVPCFDWISENNAWFDIFYEHVNYFRLSDFHRIFGTVYESGHLFGGQYLFVVADLSSLRRPVKDSSHIASLPSEFMSGIVQGVALASNHIGSAVWGAASKGVIFSMYLQRAGACLGFAMDINPAKQGRFLPSTGLSVISPERGLSRLPLGANIFVMNRNYLSEIRAMAGDAYRYFTVPFEESKN